MKKFNFVPIVAHISPVFFAYLIIEITSSANEDCKDCTLMRVMFYPRDKGKIPDIGWGKIEKSQKGFEIYLELIDKYDSIQDEVSSDHFANGKWLLPATGTTYGMNSAIKQDNNIIDEAN